MSVNTSAEQAAQQKPRRTPNWAAVRVMRERPRRAASSVGGRGHGKVLVFAPRHSRTAHVSLRNFELPPVA